jgi:hypothetical protein
MWQPLRLLLPVVGAFSAWGLWLGEVCWIKGWAGVAWLSGFNWSAVPICFVIVTISSYVVAEGAPWRNRLAFIASGFALALAAFVVARWAIFDFFSFEFFYGGEVYWAALADVLIVIAAGLAASIGFALAAHRWLAPLRVRTAGLLAAALVAVVPLSLVTIKIVPALNGSEDTIHAFKMGYPVFWTALLTPLALRLGRQMQPRLADRHPHPPVAPRQAPPSPTSGAG